jgi:hypothetical protein
MGKRYCVHTWRWNLQPGVRSRSIYISKEGGKDMGSNCTVLVERILWPALLVFSKEEK